MDKLKELSEKLSKSQALLGKIFEQAGNEMKLEKVSEISGSDEEKAAKIREINDDCAKIQKEIASLRTVDAAKKEWAERNGIVLPAEHPKQDRKPEAEVKFAGFGDAIIKSGALKNINKSFVLDPSIHVKTLMTEAAGFAPQSIRTGQIIPNAQRPIQVTDVIPSSKTDMISVVFMEETTFTNNAAEATEGTGAYGEAAFAFTERTSTIRKVAVFLPVTQEQLEDVAQLESYLNNRLVFMIRQRLDGQIMQGNGVAPNLQGLWGFTGVQTRNQADGTTDTLVTDAIYKSIVDVRVTGRAFPSHVFIHPTDWQGVRLLKSNLGTYIWGHPSLPGPDTIWGLPTVVTDALTVKRCIVADVNGFTELAEKRGVEIEMTNSHSDYFIYGKLAVRATLRVALVVYRAAAISNLTLS